MYMSISKLLSILHVTGAHGHKECITQIKGAFHEAIRLSVIKIRGFVSALCVGLSRDTAHHKWLLCLSRYGTKDFLFGKSGSSAFTSLPCISLTASLGEKMWGREMRHISLMKSILRESCPSLSFSDWERANLAKLRLNCHKAVQIKYELIFSYCMDCLENYFSVLFRK